LYESHSISLDNPQRIRLARKSMHTHQQAYALRKSERKGRA
jgi:hypothetical protein